MRISLNNAGRRVRRVFRVSDLTPMTVGTNPLVPLEMLQCGQVGTVGQIVGSPEEIHRIEELGLRAGSKVEMLQAGSPCIVRVEGHKLCFREAGRFSVLIDLGELT